MMLGVVAGGGGGCDRRTKPFGKGCTRKGFPLIVTEMRVFICTFIRKVIFFYIFTFCTLEREKNINIYMLQQLGNLIPMVRIFD